MHGQHRDTLLSQAVHLASVFKFDLVVFGNMNYVYYNLLYSIEAKEMTMAHSNYHAMRLVYHPISHIVVAQSSILFA